MSHKPLEDLVSSLEEAKTKVSVGSKYYHYRAPDKYYLVTGLAIDEATDSVMVMYKPLYIDYDITWVRRLNVWCDILMVDGSMVPRFSMVKQ